MSYTINPVGPDFDEGDMVEIIAGMYDGEYAEVMGYDQALDVYLVQIIGQSVWRPMVPSSLRLDDEDDLDDDEPEDLGFDLSNDEIADGDRVVIIYGFYLGMAGVVLGRTQMFGHQVLRIELEEGLRIKIAEASVERSIYQGEPLEEVPSV